MYTCEVPDIAGSIYNASITIQMGKWTKCELNKKYE